jgi:competence transcription factor ComK
MTQRIKEAKAMFNNKKQLLWSNNQSLEIKKETYKHFYLECSALWIRNMDPRRKWREGRKCIWNMVLEKNVKNKMADRISND